MKDIRISSEYSTTVLDVLRSRYYEDSILLRIFLPPDNRLAHEMKMQLDEAGIKQLHTWLEKWIKQAKEE